MDSTPITPTKTPAGLLAIQFVSWGLLLLFVFAAISSEISAEPHSDYKDTTFLFVWIAAPIFLFCIFVMIRRPWSRVLAILFAVIAPWTYMGTQLMIPFFYGAIWYLSRTEIKKLFGVERRHSQGQEIEELVAGTINKAGTVSHYGTLLIIPRGCDLPPNCIVCGKFTERKPEIANVDWTPPLWRIPNFLVYSILRSLFRYGGGRSFFAQTATIRYSLCDDHSPRGTRGSRLMRGFLFLFLGIAITLLAIFGEYHQARWSNAGLVQFWIGLPIAIVGVALFRWRFPLRPVCITPHEIRLKGAGIDFLHLLSKAER